MSIIKFLKKRPNYIIIVYLKLKSKLKEIQKMRSFSESIHNQETKFIKIKESFARRKNKHLIDYLIEQIGITEKSALVLINVHQCTTKEQVQIFSILTKVLQLFLSDQTGVFRHIFIPRQQDQQICQICDSKEQLHGIVNLGLIQKAIQDSSQSENNSQIEDVLSKQHFIDEPQKQCEGIVCQICYVRYQQQQMAQFSASRHNICIACMGSYIEQKISSMQIESISCPHCGLLLTQDTIKRFASEKAFLIYQQFLRNKQIQKNPNLMWCPNPKCSVVISIIKKKKVFECPKCNIKICCKCNRQAHSGQSCNSVFKNQIKQWENSSSIQKCKKCSSIVQKISGCNHMSCSVCGHEWCWLCGANYSQRHFNPMNPFGCAGMQDRHGIGKCRIFLWRIILFMLILIAVPCTLPFAMLLSGPFFTIEALYKKVQYDGNRFKKFLAIVCGFVIGLVFNPIIWIGILIVYFPKLIDIIRDYLRNRRRRIQNSDNRLNQRLINDAILNSQNFIVVENHNQNGQ